MQSELIIAVLAGLGGMLGWGVGDFFAKKTVDKLGPIVSLVWAHLFGTAILLLVALYQIFVLKQQLNIPYTVTTWLLLIFFGSLQATVYLLAYKAFEKGQVAVLNPIFASFTGVVALVSFLFFGEVATFYRISAIIIIFIGVMLISVDIKGLTSKKLNVVPGLKEIGLATILAAFWTLGWDRFVNGHDFVSYTLFMYAFMTFSAFLFAKYTKAKLKVAKTGIWKFLILIGLCETVAYLAITLGYSATSLVSVVAIISGAFSLPTIVLARIFLKEKITTIQTIGSIVVIAGIIFLSI